MSFEKILSRIMNRPSAILIDSEIMSTIMANIIYENILRLSILIFIGTIFAMSLWERWKIHTDFSID
jgi:hypothetical protein